MWSEHPCSLCLKILTKKDEVEANVARQTLLASSHNKYEN